MHKFKFWFVTVFTIAFVTLIFSQIFLKSESFRNKLSVLHKLESQYVFSEQDVEFGYIIIEVSDPSEGLFLLQNGEKTKSLNKVRVKIDISDNSVVEIDGRNSETSSDIKIVETSDNIDGFYEDKVIVKSDIVILGSFFVK